MNYGGIFTLAALPLCIAGALVREFVIELRERRKLQTMLDK